MRNYGGSLIKGPESKRGQLTQAKPLLGKGMWGSVTNSTTSKTSTYGQAVHCRALGESVARTMQSWQACIVTPMFSADGSRGLVPTKLIYYDNFLTYGGKVF